MDKLQQARETIDEADAQIAKLFEQRMQAVKVVAEYKKENGMPILDSSREQQVIQKNMALVDDMELRSFYVQFQKEMMKVSRLYQHTLFQGIRVGYSGVEGAFANIAATRLFPDAQLFSFNNFEEAYQAVVDGDCELAVLPIENSYAGEVGQVQDLMFNGPLYVNGVYDLAVKQNLLGVKGAKIEDIETVVSHPQALSQCGNYIRRHRFTEVQSSNTAVAANQVATANDIHTAAIASLETAQLYDLEVLDYDINESSTNTTRFAVFSKVYDNRVKGKDNCFILLFTVKNTAGSLASAMNIIGSHDYNMRVLRSRPMKSLAWNYYFYVEAEGDVNGPNGQQMLKQLSVICDKLKVIGNYTANCNLDDYKEGN